MAIGQTTVLYGNFGLSRCVTLDFKQEPVYDDISQTDLMYHRYTVHVLGYIHGVSDWLRLGSPFTVNDGVDNYPGSATLNLIGMRVSLPPRQTFTYRIGADSTGAAGGYVALYCEPAVERPIGITHMDVNNGPRCKSFVVKRVVSDNVFEVEAEFEVCKVECQVDASVDPSSGSDAHTAGTVPTSKLNGILSNRWSVVDDIDANLKTVRTYHGRLRTASANIDPNQFRYYVTPPLMAGMRRDHIQFSVTPDGLNLDYTITDLEVAYSAPYPAKKWSIQHTESVDQALTARGAIDIVMSGDRGVDKGKLITIAMNVIQSKLLGQVPNQGNAKHYMESLSITDFIGDDQVVSVSARIRRAANQGELQDPFLDWRIASGVIGQVLTPEMVNEPTEVDADYDSDVSFGGRDGEAPAYEGPISLLGMFLPYLQTPCNDLHKIVLDGDDLPDDENEPANATPRTTVTAKVVEPMAMSDDDLYSESTLEALYTSWKMESVYKDLSMKAALPIASSYSSYTTKIVTLSRPQCRRIVRAEAERVGAWPEMPSAEQIEALVGSTPGVTQTYLGRRRRFPTPFYTAGGQKAYRVAVEFYLALNKMPSASDELIVGRSMWTTEGDIKTTADVTEGWV